MYFKGKNLEEALINAETSTQRKREEFIYEVTQKKSGFLKSKELVVNIKGFKEKSTIKLENSKLIFNPKDINPFIEADENVSIIVNGRAVNGRVQIKETDEVVIKTIDTEAKRDIAVYVSDDKIQAILEIVIIAGRKYELVDSPEGSDIKIKAKVVEEILPENYTYDEAKKYISENKITYGLIQENIKGVLSGGKCIAAQGLKPEKPTPDTIEYFFNTKIENKPLEVDGKVDYYNIGETEFVEEGKILALRKEGKDGKPGYDVFGKPIATEKRTLLRLAAGNGAEVLDNGNKIIASLKGMPSLKNDRICVFPVHTINGDVNIKTGNIQFEGDILVKGNATEGLCINSGNSLTILGEATEAKLYAGGNVTVQKSAILSTIVAGEKQLAEVQGVDEIKNINGIFNKIIEGYQEIKSAKKVPQHVRDNQILKIILESKFNSFKSHIAEVNESVFKHCYNQNLKDAWKESTGLFKLIENNLINNIEIIKNQSKKLNEIINNTDILLSPADVVVGYSQNSTIKATNDLIVKGKGCYNTNVIVENKAIFTGNPGIFRGGQLYAKNYISIKESGSNAGVLTILKTSWDGTIEVKLAYQNTILNIGDQIYKVDYPVKMLKAYIQKGEIIVEKLKA